MDWPIDVEIPQAFASGLGTDGGIVVAPMINKHLLYASAGLRMQSEVLQSFEPMTSLCKRWRPGDSNRCSVVLDNAFCEIALLVTANLNERHRLEGPLSFSCWVQPSHVPYNEGSEIAVDVAGLLFVR